MVTTKVVSASNTIPSLVEASPVSDVGGVGRLTLLQKPGPND